VPRTALVLAAFASLLGCAGVLAGAAGAHAGGNELARTASLYLILHGCALLGVAASVRAVASARALIAAGFALGAGALVFSADLASRAFAGDRLFPFAAPIGGSLMILSWLALALVFGAAAMRAPSIGAR
jgi:uncharacterized membrane protein YgdD (TMEM256/DUF423 family)